MRRLRQHRTNDRPRYSRDLDLDRSRLEAAVLTAGIVVNQWISAVVTRVVTALDSSVRVER